MKLLRRKETITKHATEKVEKADADIPSRLLTILQSVQELERKPPVTFALLGVMYMLHMQVKQNPSPFLQFSLCPDKVVANYEIGAMVIAPFIHLDEAYLYQSMLSLVWKGYKLEAKLGSLGFCILLVYLIVLSQVLIVFGAYMISPVSQYVSDKLVEKYEPDVMVILNVGSPSITNFYNFKVPTKYAAWLELLLTYVMVPKLPLLAQAAGLITGYLYIVTPNADALVKYAACRVYQLLVQVRLVKKPYRWWQVWPKFVDSMRRRKLRIAAQC
ncbi:hypothetical protein Plhal304r1_c005g0021291 [Plasmopara halstedii]